MKILHTVESYLPSRHGMSEVVRQISECLANLGHQVFVATSYDINRHERIIKNVHIIEFKISGNITHGIRGEFDKYVRFLLESDFDIITNFAAQQWATDLALPILPKIKGKKVLVPTGFSGLYLSEFQPYFQQMKEWLSEYDQVIYLSENYRDINFARDLGLKNETIIPNGASYREFVEEPKTNIRKKICVNESDFLILHVSGYIGNKGHCDAIRIFKRAKIKNATLLLVSPDFRDFNSDFWSLIEQLFKIIKSRGNLEFFFLILINIIQHILPQNKRIRFISLTRAETVSAFRESNLFLFPSHLECSPIVLFECMAAKIPFLVTDVGNSKEIIEWSGSGILLPTIKNKIDYGYSIPKIKESARILKEISKNSILREKMAKSGFDAWINNFSWEKIAERYEKLYFHLIEQSDLKEFRQKP